MSELDLDLVKISELPSTEHVSAEDVVPVVQSGVTKKVKSTAFRKYVTDSLGTAATASRSEFEPAGSMLEVDLKSQARADEQNTRIDRIEVAAYLLRNNKIFKAYRNKALMLADVTNIPANSLLNVVADPANDAETNDINGQYHYDGTDFLKLPDDILAMVDRKTGQVEVDAKAYADQVVANAINVAADDAETRANVALDEAKLYADDKKNEAIQVASDDAQSKANTALDEAKLLDDVLLHLIKNVFKNNRLSLDTVFDEEANKYLLSVFNEALDQIMFGITSNAELSLGDLFLKRDADQFYVSDHAGKVYFRYKNGKIYFNNLVVDTASSNLLLLTDESGKTLFRLSKKGQVYFANLGDATGSASESEKLFQAITLTGQWKIADVNHLVFYGQSLSRDGGNPIPALTTSQPFHNLMMAGGVITTAYESTYISDSVAPLIETTYETIASPTTNGISERYVATYGATDLPVFLASSTGKGGQTVKNLSKGTSWYSGTLQVIKDAKAICDAENKSYSNLGYVWIQGEANAATNQAIYIEDVRKLKQDFDRDILAITGQDFLPSMFISQVANHRRYGNKTMRVALAQLNMSNENEDIVLVAPNYMFPHTPDDHIHLTNEGYWLFGQYIARAMFETLFTRKKWKPLQPTWVTWSGTQIVIGGWNIRGDTLVLDDALTALAPNFGFDLFTQDTQELIDIISNVEVTAFDEITITLSENAPINATLSCGKGRDTEMGGSYGGSINGARTNVRDNHGDYEQVASPTATLHALHNMSVMWQYNRKQGFNAI